HTTATSAAPAARSASISAGTSVLWPAACVDTPTTCTSFSTACRATSSGVWNSGPTSTSKPRSANAVAITLAPRACPSCPRLATAARDRGDLGAQGPELGIAGEGRRVHARHAADLGAVPPEDLLERGRDLADAGARARGLDRQLEQVRAARRAALQRLEGRL